MANCSNNNSTMSTTMERQQSTQLTLSQRLGVRNMGSGPLLPPFHICDGYFPQAPWSPPPPSQQISNSHMRPLKSILEMSLPPHSTQAGQAGRGHEVAGYNPKGAECKSTAFQPIPPVATATVHPVEVTHSTSSESRQHSMQESQRNSSTTVVGTGTSRSKSLLEGLHVRDQEKGNLMKQKFMNSMHVLSKNNPPQNIHLLDVQSQKFRIAMHHDPLHTQPLERMKNSLWIVDSILNNRRIGDLAVSCDQSLAVIASFLHQQVWDQRERQGRQVVRKVIDPNVEHTWSTLQPRFSSTDILIDPFAISRAEEKCADMRASGEQCSSHTLDRLSEEYKKHYDGETDSWIVVPPREVLYAFQQARKRLSQLMQSSLSRKKITDTLIKLVKHSNLGQPCNTEFWLPMHVKLLTRPMSKDELHPFNFPLWSDTMDDFEDALKYEAMAWNTLKRIIVREEAKVKLNRDSLKKTITLREDAANSRKRQADIRASGDAKRLRVGLISAEQYYAVKQAQEIVGPTTAEADEGINIPGAISHATRLRLQPISQAMQRYADGGSPETPIDLDGEEDRPTKAPSSLASAQALVEVTQNVTVQTPRHDALSASSPAQTMVSELSSEVDAVKAKIYIEEKAKVPAYIEMTREMDRAMLAHAHKRALNKIKHRRRAVAIVKQLQARAIEQNIQPSKTLLEEWKKNAYQQARIDVQVETLAADFYEQKRESAINGCRPNATEMDDLMKEEAYQEATEQTMAFCEVQKAYDRLPQQAQSMQQVIAPEIEAELRRQAKGEGFARAMELVTAQKTRRIAQVHDTEAEHIRMTEDRDTKCHIGHASSTRSSQSPDNTSILPTPTASRASLMSPTTSASMLSSGVDGHDSPIRKPLKPALVLDRSKNLLQSANTTASGTITVRDVQSIHAVGQTAPTFRYCPNAPMLPRLQTGVTRTPTKPAQSPARGLGKSPGKRLPNQQVQQPAQQTSIATEEETDKTNAPPQSTSIAQMNLVGTTDLRLPDPTKSLSPTTITPLLPSPEPSNTAHAGAKRKAADAATNATDGNANEDEIQVTFARPCKRSRPALTSPYKLMFMDSAIVGDWEWESESEDALRARMLNERERCAAEASSARMTDACPELDLNLGILPPGLFGENPDGPGYFEAAAEPESDYGFTETAISREGTGWQYGMDWERTLVSVSKQRGDAGGRQALTRAAKVGSYGHIEEREPLTSEELERFAFKTDAHRQRLGPHSLAPGIAGIGYAYSHEQQREVLVRVPKYRKSFGEKS